MGPALRVAFVTGATPDKWARAWRGFNRGPLDLVPVSQSDQERVVREGTVDMAIVRLPVDGSDMHCVRLYEEHVVAVAARDHFLAAADGNVTTADLAGEQLVRPHVSGWAPDAEQMPWPPMSEQEAVATVAAGTGVALMPMSVARLYQRKDVVQRTVSDLSPTEVGLIWLVTRDDEVTQTFVGVTRGRTANSSR